MRPIDNISHHSEWSEKAIEKYLCDRVRELGGVCLKYSNPNDVGYPDRIVVMPDQTFWVELKSKGKKPTLRQKLRIMELRRLGAAVYVADSKEAIDEILAKHEI